MIRDTPALSEISSAIRKGKENRQYTLLHKSFPGGHITLAGSNSPASLASRPVRIVLFDEVDRFPYSAGAEGDPVTLGKKRTTTFPESAFLSWFQLQQKKAHLKN
jgi:phage terminase large subunit GpA-like protein